MSILLQFQPSPGAAPRQPAPVTSASPPPQPAQVTLATPQPEQVPPVPPSHASQPEVHRAAPSLQPGQVPLPTPLSPLQPGRKPRLPSPSELITIRNQAVSRRNFAKLLSVHTFSEEERRVSNVKGRQGKKQLSPNRMDELEAAVFRLYPLEQKENADATWRDCIKAIDEASRKLPK